MMTLTSSEDPGSSFGSSQDCINLLPTVHTDAENTSKDAYTPLQKRRKLVFIDLPALRIFFTGSIATEGTSSYVGSGSWLLIKGWPRRPGEGEERKNAGN